MMLDYSHPGKVKITMMDYIKLILHEVPEDMAGTAATQQHQLGTTCLR